MKKIVWFLCFVVVMTPFSMVTRGKEEMDLVVDVVSPPDQIFPWGRLSTRIEKTKDPNKVFVQHELIGKTVEVFQPANVVLLYDLSGFMDIDSRLILSEAEFNQNYTQRRQEVQNSYSLIDGRKPWLYKFHWQRLNDYFKTLEKKNVLGHLNLGFAVWNSNLPLSQELDKNLSTDLTLPSFDDVDPKSESQNRYKQLRFNPNIDQTGLPDTTKGAMDNVVFQMKSQPNRKNILLLVSNFYSVWDLDPPVHDRVLANFDYEVFKANRTLFDKVVPIDVDGIERRRELYSTGIEYLTSVIPNETELYAVNSPVIEAPKDVTQAVIDELEKLNTQLVNHLFEARVDLDERVILSSLHHSHGKRQNLSLSEVSPKLEEKVVISYEMTIPGPLKLNQKLPLSTTSKINGQTINLGEVVAKRNFKPQLRRPVLIKGEQVDPQTLFTNLPQGARVTLSSDPNLMTPGKQSLKGTILFREQDTLTFDIPVDVVDLDIKPIHLYQYDQLDLSKLVDARLGVIRLVDQVDTSQCGTFRPRAQLIYQDTLIKNLNLEIVIQGFTSVKEIIEPGKPYDFSDNITNCPGSCTVRLIDSINVHQPHIGRARVEVTLSDKSRHLAYVDYEVLGSKPTVDSKGSGLKGPSISDKKILDSHQQGQGALSSSQKQGSLSSPHSTSQQGSTSSGYMTTPSSSTGLSSSRTTLGVEKTGQGHPAPLGPPSPSQGMALPRTGGIR